MPPGHNSGGWGLGEKLSKYPTYAMWFKREICFTLKVKLSYNNTERIDAGNIRQIKEELCNCQMKHRLNKN